jgi:hypothetical protein
MDARCGIAIILTRKICLIHHLLHGYSDALRNQTGRCFNKPRNAIRLVTCYDKALDSYRALETIALSPPTMKHFVKTT